MTLKPITLKRRLAIQISWMLAGVLFLGTAAALGVAGLHQDFGVALRANEDLRQVYTIGSHVALAKAALEQSPPAPNRALTEMRLAMSYFELNPPPDRDPNKVALQARLRVGLQTSIAQLQSGSPADTALVTPAYAALADLSAAARQTIASTQHAADQKQQLTLVAVLSAALLTIGICIWIASRQYRATVGPLCRMQQTVGAIAAGRFEQRLIVEGDREFALLAEDFNRMADELQGVYSDLERRVELKSRQLVQSERLASVGYLAAGVAHEINNPLGIIAGYGERSLRRLDRSWSAGAVAPVREAIQIICDEAFRCKAITDRLLSLARSGDSARQPISLRALAAEVVHSLGGLPKFANRQISLDVIDPAAELRIVGVEGEIRQVILNLLVNALDAVGEANGRVVVSLTRKQSEIELTIADNGHGMTPQTLRNVFEPFFTERRDGQRGTGLGLSVVHAIVTAHHGKIEAQSDGPGKGSRFIVTLPAASALATTEAGNAIHL